MNNRIGDAEAKKGWNEKCMRSHLSMTGKERGKIAYMDG